MSAPVKLAAFAGALRADRLHHAWLLTGPPGLGKATLAYRFARWMLAGQPGDAPGEAPLHVPEGDPVFRRVAAGARFQRRADDVGRAARRTRTP